MKHSEGTFLGVDNLELYYQTWQPDKAARAALVIVHGLGEHGGRYMNLVNHLVPERYAIYTFDQRGYGRSPGKKGFINSWAEYREDVRTFVQMVRSQAGERPFFLMGHSMGGCVTADYVLHYPDGLTGVILSAPAVGKLNVPKSKELLSSVFSSVLPSLASPTGLDTTALSRDTAVVEAYKNDPSVHDKGTPRLGTEFPKTALWCMDHAAEFQPPLLMIHGGADRIVSVEQTKIFFAKVQQSDKKLIIYEGGYHEPHNDIHYQQVVADIANWLDEKVKSDED